MPDKTTVSLRKGAHPLPIETESVVKFPEIAAAVIQSRLGESVREFSSCGCG
jgi:hypothetical protein